MLLFLKQSFYHLTLTLSTFSYINVYDIIHARKTFDFCIQNLWVGMMCVDYSRLHKMEEDLHFLANGRWPKFFHKWKATYIFVMNGRRPQLIHEWKTSSIFGNWKTSSIFSKWKTTLIFAKWIWLVVKCKYSVLFRSKLFP